MSNIINKESVQKIVTSYNLIEDVKSTIQSIQSQSDSSIINQIVSTLETIDQIVKKPLSEFSNQTVAGTWAQSQHGIGPVLSAGLVSYLDIAKANSPAAVWRYAGLDPSHHPGKSFNSDLKTLCWKIGSSFSKHSSNPRSFYGNLYLQDKERRTLKNEQGLYSDKAAELLKDLPYKYRSDKALLSQGKISSNQIDAQARRFSVKIFLSHYYSVAYQEIHGTPAVRPSFITINGKKEFIQIPNNPF
jgi:hypothetical protein